MKIETTYTLYESQLEEIIRQWLSNNGLCIDEEEIDIEWSEAGICLVTCKTEFD